MDRTNQDSDLDKRLTNLEIQLSLTEDLAERLNDVVVRQQAQIDLLIREVARLEKKAQAGDATGFRSLRDEIPPHY